MQTTICMPPRSPGDQQTHNILCILSCIHGQPSNRCETCAQSLSVRQEQEQPTDRSPWWWAVLASLFQPAAVPRYLASPKVSQRHFCSNEVYCELKAVRDQFFLCQILVSNSLRLLNPRIFTSLQVSTEHTVHLLLPHLLVIHTPSYKLR